MTGLDIILLVIIGASMLFGFFRGFFSESVSLLSWVLAFWVAFNLETLSIYNKLYFIADIGNETLRLWVSRFFVIVIIMIVGSLLNRLLSKIVTWKLFGNKFLGLLFGFGRGFILSALLIVGLSDTAFYEEPWVKKSFFLPIINNGITALFLVVSDDQNKQQSTLK